MALDKNIKQIINQLKKNRKNLDEGNIGFGIAINLQIAFDTVEHDFLFSKIGRYVIITIININKWEVKI